MARKTTIPKATKLPKLSRENLSNLGKVKPVDGCEAQWARYLAAVDALMWADATYDAIYLQVEREGGTSSSPTWAAFEAQGKKVMRLTGQAFGALDAYTFAVKHVNDKIEAAQDEVRGTIIDSLSDKLDEIQFSVNHGLLGAKIAQALAHDVTPFDMGDPPMCEDCV